MKAFWRKSRTSEDRQDRAFVKVALKSISDQPGAETPTVNPLMLKGLWIS